MRNARERFDAYVQGLSQSVVVRRELDKLADDMQREYVEAAAKPHGFYNDRGGNAVCTKCWKSHERE